MTYLDAISTGFRACLRDCLEILLVGMDPNASARAFGVSFRSIGHSASPRLLSGASGLERNELSEYQLEMGSDGFGGGQVLAGGRLQKSHHSRVLSPLTAILGLLSPQSSRAMRRTCELTAADPCWHDVSRCNLDWLPRVPSRLPRDIACRDGP